MHCSPEQHRDDLSRCSGRQVLSWNFGRGNKLAAMFQGGQYDKLEESVFLFDRRVDCWTDGRYMFIVNIANFERIFRYFEELRGRAEST